MQFAEILDDPRKLSALDPKDVLGLTVDFPNQCAKAIDIFERSNFQPPTTEIHNVVVCGMGGSAAGGDLFRCIAEQTGGVPVEVIRDYTLPKYVGKHTWCIFVSYSGNTEETLSSYRASSERGGPRLCITSGGELAELAAKGEVQVIRVPGGQPPRTALGFMFVPLVLAGAKAGIIEAIDFSHLHDDLQAMREQFGPDKPYAENGAKWLAGELFQRLPFIYGLGTYQGAVAYRWKCQINENSKVHAHANALPEMNHNEIMGWTKAHEVTRAYSVVCLFDGTESQRMFKRWDVTLKLIDPIPVHGLRVEGRDLLTKILSMCYMGDFVSVYLARLNEVDPENIDNINTLKAALAET